MTKKSRQKLSWEQKELLKQNKKHFSLTLKGFHWVKKHFFGRWESEEKMNPMLTGGQKLHCNQVISTTKFISWKTSRTFNILFDFCCKTEYIIDLMECILYKIWYVQKAEATFDLRLNNHRKDETWFHTRL